MNVVKMKKNDGIYVDSTEMLSSKERGELLQLYQKDDLVSKLKQAEIYHSEWKTHKVAHSSEKGGFKEWCENYSNYSYDNCQQCVKVWDKIGITMVTSNIAELNTSMRALRSLAYAEDAIREELIPKLLSGAKFTSVDVEVAEAKLRELRGPKFGLSKEELKEWEESEKFDALTLEEQLKDDTNRGANMRILASQEGVDVDAVLNGDTTTLYESVDVPRKKTVDELKDDAIKSFKKVIDARFYEVIETLDEKTMQNMLNANDTFEQFVIAVCKHNGWKLEI